MSDWWEEYVYLRGRSPLMVNSNFYGIDALFLENTRKQSARAAMAISLLLKFRRLVERQELQPVTFFFIFTNTESGNDFVFLLVSNFFFLWILFRLWHKAWYHFVHGNMNVYSIPSEFRELKVTKSSITWIQITLL